MTSAATGEKATTSVPVRSGNGAAATATETHSRPRSIATDVSIAARVADEIGEFLHVAVLWFLLNSAAAPVNVVVSALPFPLERRLWHAAVLSAVGVGVVRYYDPSWELVRGFVVGVATTATFASLYVFSGLSRAVVEGGSWLAVAAVAGFWVVGVAVGVALAHPLTWRRLRTSVAVE